MTASYISCCDCDAQYVCVSLCEDFILAHLMLQLHPSLPTPLRLSMEIVTPASRSPFKPFFLVLSKPKTRDILLVEPRVEVFFDSFGSPTKAPVSLSLAATSELVQQAQAFCQKRFQLGQVQVGRYEVFDVHAQPSPSSEVASTPRFSILIFDHAARAARSCAVFLVPPGRETDYQFTSESGLAELAAQAQCRRLLAVRCNRPHVFPAMAELQSELSPIALYLTPADCGPADEDLIPFLAVQHDSEWEIVAQGELEVAGPFVVEERGAENDEDADKFVWRRLLFLQNQHFVQTEARLLNPAHASKHKQSKGGGKGKSKGKGKGKNKSSKEKDRGDQGAGEETSSDLCLFDHSYLDDHHKAMLAALLCDNTDIVSAGSQARGSCDASMEEDCGGARALLVGLGGGALAMALQRFLPSLHLEVLDLVPGLDALAAQHFGFVAGPRCRTIVQDGVQFIMQRQQPSSHRYHSVLLDVDSKDNSLGVSAPPAAFLERAFLEHLHDHVLLPGGSLCINVVARDKCKLAELVCQLKSIFCAPVSTEGPGGKVYSIKPSADTVNQTLHAVKGVCPLSPPSGLAKHVEARALSSSKQNRAKKESSTGHGTHVFEKMKLRGADAPRAELSAMENSLCLWLSAVNRSRDQLELCEIIDQITEA